MHLFAFIGDNKREFYNLTHLCIIYVRVGWERPIGQRIAWLEFLSNMKVVNLAWTWPWTSWDVHEGLWRSREGLKFTLTKSKLEIVYSHIWASLLCFNYVIPANLLRKLLISMFTRPSRSSPWTSREHGSPSREFIWRSVNLMNEIHLYSTPTIGRISDKNGAKTMAKPY